MSYINVYVHYVWATKNREPYLRKEIQKQVFEHIKANAKKKGFFVDFVNGQVNHVHCLVSLNSEIRMARLLN